MSPLDRWLGPLVVTVMLSTACGSDTTTTTSGSTAPPTTAATSTTSGDRPTTATPTTTSSTTVPTTVAPGQTMLVYFGEGDGTDCTQVGAHERTVATDADPIRAAFDELVHGPTAEEQLAGAGSFFGEGTVGMVRSTWLDDGSLVVDLEDRRTDLANASTSCGSAAFLSELTQTAFQFPEVETVQFTMGGSCNRFMNFLQGECTNFHRDGTSVSLPTIERAGGSGCTPGSGPLPDGRWFGLVNAASEAQVSFDLACWFSIPAAVDAAAEDGEESPPPNDYHIRNDAEVWRNIDVSPGLVVSWLPVGNPASQEDIPYADWLVVRQDRDYNPNLWLTIEDGVIAAIEEQYQP
ncbi:MAG: GerMN domain-containing protein [Acidimicrobiales bacterium]|nr:GerMN domain-containing protein [Acidimicrobiales bacterium]RZV46076.1 MAG: hypothetical protein EX269_08215 [Acidimicrobiales bacterium]